MQNLQRPGSSCSNRSGVSTGRTLKTWKIIVVGAPKVGKTTLVFKYTTGKLPNQETDKDLIPEFMEKKVALPEQQEQVYVSIWNLPHRTKSTSSVPKSFFVGVHGCLFVFSTVDQSSFTDLANW